MTKKQIAGVMTHSDSAHANARLQSAGDRYRDAIIRTLTAAARYGDIEPLHPELAEKRESGGGDRVSPRPIEKTLWRLGYASPSL